MTFAPRPSTVEQPGGGRGFRHWDKVFILVVAAAILAVMLYIDHRLDVWSVIPLRTHPSTPLQDFLFVGTFLFPIGALGLVADLEDVLHAMRSAGWPTVTGKVLNSEVEHNFGKGPQFTALVRYEYQVGGQRYEGFTIHFSQRKFRLAETADEVIRRYPAGSAVDVFYDPSEPEMAVLETTSSDAYFSLMWSLVILLVPFLMYFEFFRGVLHG